MAGLILYENKLRSATVVSEATVTNYEIEYALDGKLVTQAGFASGANRDVIFDMGSATSVDTIALARHNFSDITNVDFFVAGSADNVSYTDLAGTLNVSDSSVFIESFTSASYRYYRLRFNSTSGNAFVSDIFLGTKLSLERSQYYGFIKPEFADSDTIRYNITRGRNLAGIAVDRELKRVTFDLKYYTASFFSTHWENLVATMKLYPIYIKWDTSEANFYCWPQKSIPEPRYSSDINGYYDVSLDMQGITV